MKTLLVSIFTLTTSVLFGQQLACCSKPTNNNMVAMATDPAFIAAHQSPEPFNYAAQAGKMTTFPTPDGDKGSAYVVMAATKTDNYLIITHEWWGLNDYIKQRADELQKALGNVNVIAIDMYDGKVTANPDSAGKLVAGAKDDRIKNIIKGAIAYAGKDAHILSIGWCFGGGYSLQTAILAGKQATGCVMYYGMPEKNVEVLKDLNCEVLGLFASQDGWITPEVVKAFQDDMKAAGKTLTVKEYNAKHAFANPSNGNKAYDKASADDANKATEAFLKKKLQ